VEEVAEATSPPATLVVLVGLVASLFGGKEPFDIIIK